MCQNIICGIFRKAPEAKGCDGIIRKKGDWSDELFLNHFFHIYILYITNILSFFELFLDNVTVIFLFRRVIYIDGVNVLKLI